MNQSKKGSTLSTNSESGRPSTTNVLQPFMTSKPSFNKISLLIAAVAVGGLFASIYFLVSGRQPDAPKTSMTPPEAIQDDELEKIKTKAESGDPSAQNRFGE